MQTQTLKKNKFGQIGWALKLGLIYDLICGEKDREIITCVMCNRSYHHLRQSKRMLNFIINY